MQLIEKEDPVGGNRVHHCSMAAMRREENGKGQKRDADHAQKRKGTNLNEPQLVSFNSDRVRARPLDAIVR